MESSAVRAARPRPEESACQRRSTNSKARARVSKDEDERLGLPSCFETHRSALGLWKRQRSRRAAMLLSMRVRVRGAFWRNEAKREPACLVRANTNLRMCETTAGAISLLPIVIYNEFCNCNVSVAFERSNSLHSDVVERAHAARCVVV